MSNIKKLALVGGEPIVSSPFPKWPIITDQDIDAVVSTLKNEELSAYEVVNGPLYDFEQEICHRFNVKYALLVSSGTAALQSAMFALNLEPHDEVICPTISFPATASIALHFGASVRFVDVDKHTGNPSLDQIKHAITDHTRAVIIAHAWGLAAELKAIAPYLKQRGIVLIEDAARALGGSCDGMDIGTIGDIGCFSFHELKAIPAGEGGVVLTNNRNYYERAVALGHYFRCKEKYHLFSSNLTRYKDSSLGLNLKIHPLAASLARSQFKYLDSRIETLEKNHKLFSDYLDDYPFCSAINKPIWVERAFYYGFNFRWISEQCDYSISLNTIVSAFRAEGIHAAPIGNPPLYQLPLFADSVSNNRPLPGRVVGSIDDYNFPGSVEHAITLCRLPNVVSTNPIWIKYYSDAFEKIFSNLDRLAYWEQQTYERKESL